MKRSGLKAGSRVLGLMGAALLLFLIETSSLVVEAKGKNAKKEMKPLPQILTVSQAGDAMYPTIQSAVDAAKDGDIIEIQPGIYEETVQTGNKELHLQGVNPANCILENETGHYLTPPLTMYKGTVSGLTIRALKPEKIPVRQPEEEPWIYNYCIHADDLDMTGNHFQIENCTLVSYTGCPLGVGVHGDYSIQVSRTIIDNRGQRAAVFLHDAATEGFGKASISFEDCQIMGEKDSEALVFDHFSDLNQTQITLRNMIFADSMQIIRRFQNIVIDALVQEWEEENVTEVETKAETGDCEEEKMSLDNPPRESSVLESNVDYFF